MITRSNNVAWFLGRPVVKADKTQCGHEPQFAAPQRNVCILKVAQ
jgi:hypothetical protein